jgi:cysteinyl-tRNA synthetase
MKMLLYNTLTRKKEELQPISDNTVRVYSCGPTVYFSAHIGNMRAYLFTDLLKKVIKFNGMKLLDVMNITDVGHLVTDADDGEDKMERAAKEQGIDPQAIAEKYTAEFLGDLKKLNIDMPAVLAPATEHITEMIDFIKGLEAKGFTYVTGDGVYFDASKFPNYSALSGASIEGNRGGARIELGEKRNVNDFALWKFVSPNTIQKWDSPWGVGCPGWHIECSAMAQKYLADTFDIHTGGIDAIPIHHTNEIAQTESLTGKKMCNFWCHNEFMTISGGKMSKSLGNAYTISDLEARGFEPMVFRYFVLLANYRTILNFTFDGLEAARNAYENLIGILARHYAAGYTKSAGNTQAYLDEFREEVSNDLNTPKAIAVMWKAVKESPSREIYDLVIKMDEVLSLSLTGKVAEHLASQDSKVDVPYNVKDLADKRKAAKQNKDYVTADKLRAEVTALGYELIDTKDGYEIKKI